MSSFGLGLTVGFVAGGTLIAVAIRILLYRMIEAEERRDREWRL